MTEVNKILLIETMPLIESFSRTAPLGLRFWDEVSGKIVGDGLVVTAYPPESPLRRVEATVNRSGVYVLSGLPGLRRTENGNGNAAFWNSPPAKVTYQIEVVDSWRRFLPFLMTIEAPIRGIVTSIDPAAGETPTSRGIPLYSTAMRSVPASMAVVRAQLREWKSAGDHEGDPARWAVVEARVAGRRLARGVADENGAIALLFPYPAPVTHPLGSPPTLSPPGAEGPALRDQQWPIQLVASFDKLGPDPATPGVPALPKLKDVLRQSPATLWADTERLEVLADSVLSFGREMVVKSIDRATRTERSVLLISAAGSPP